MTLFGRFSAFTPFLSEIQAAWVLQRLTSSREYSHWDSNFLIHSFEWYQLAMVCKSFQYVLSQHEQTQIATTTLGTPSYILSSVASKYWYVDGCFCKVGLCAEQHQQRAQAARSKELMGFAIIVQRIRPHSLVPFNGPMQTLRCFITQKHGSQTKNM